MSAATVAEATGARPPAHGGDDWQRQAERQETISVPVGRPHCAAPRIEQKSPAFYSLSVAVETGSARQPTRAQPPATACSRPNEFGKRRRGCLSRRLARVSAATAGQTRPRRARSRAPDPRARARPHLYPDALDTVRPARARTVERLLAEDSLFMTLRPRRRRRSTTTTIATSTATAATAAISRVLLEPRRPSRSGPQGQVLVDEGLGVETGPCRRTSAASPSTCWCCRPRGSRDR